MYRLQASRGSIIPDFFDIFQSSLPPIIAMLGRQLRPIQETGRDCTCPSFGPEYFGITSVRTAPVGCVKHRLGRVGRSFFILQPVLGHIIITDIPISILEKHVPSAATAKHGNSARSPMYLFPYAYGGVPRALGSSLCPT